MIEIEAVFSGIAKFFSGIHPTLSQPVIAKQHVWVVDLAHGESCLLLFIRVFRHPHLDQVVFRQPKATGPLLVDEDGGIPHPMMQGHQDRIIPRLCGGKRGVSGQGQPLRGLQIQHLPNQDGQKVKLADFQGKTLLLFAYPKAATGGCTTQACGFRDSYADVGGLATIQAEPLSTET